MAGWICYSVRGRVGGVSDGEGSDDGSNRVGGVGDGSNGGVSDTVVVGGELAVSWRHLQTPLVHTNYSHTHRPVCMCSRLVVF